MIPGGRVSFTYSWDIEQVAELLPAYSHLAAVVEISSYQVLLDVRAEISSYYPAVMRLHNGDPGYPAEGGTVEDIQVFLPDGAKLDPIPEGLYDDLVGKALEEHADV